MEKIGTVSKIEDMIEVNICYGTYSSQADHLSDLDFLSLSLSLKFFESMYAKEIVKKGQSLMFF